MGDVDRLEKYSIQRAVKKVVWAERSAKGGAAFINDARQNLYAAEHFMSAARFSRS